MLSHRSSRLLRALLIGGALAAGWFVYGWLYLRAENHPWAVGFCVVLAGLLAYGWYRRQHSVASAAYDRAVKTLREADVWDRYPARAEISVGWIAPTVIVLAFGAYAVIHGATARNNYLRIYCEYGAKSSAQLDQCMAHVNTEQINKLDTQAGRFARGDTSECLAGSGPFCQAASRYNSYQSSDVAP